MFPDSDPEQLYEIYKREGHNLGRLIQVLEEEKDVDGRMREHEQALLGQVYMDEMQRQSS